jgi:DNA-binding GntR family transcriptional regulator
MAFEAYDRIFKHITANPGWPKGHTEERIATAIGWDWHGKPDELRAALAKHVEYGNLKKIGDEYSLVDIDDEDITRYLELREGLEIFLARRLVRRLEENKDEDLLAGLRQAHLEANNAVESFGLATTESDREKYRLKFIDACRSFHTSFGKAAAYRIAGEPLERLWEFAWLVYGRRHNHVVTEDHMKSIRDEHKAILDAILLKDEREAVQERKVVKAVGKHYYEIRQRSGTGHPWRKLEIRPSPVLISILREAGRWIVSNLHYHG